jgi:GDP-D-mannose dehydratase
VTRALITGLSGFVGSHLADYLLEHTQWEIYGLIRWRSPLDNITHLLPRINKKDRIHLVYGDLRDSDSINNAIRDCLPDYVFHLAAQSYPKTSFSSPLDTYETNVQGTSRILEALRQYKKDAIIHVCSSSEVFGRVSKDKLPINEECGFHPASPYAISKVGTDLIGRFYAEAYGMNVQTTRMFTHSVSRWTPVILRDRDSGLVDIKYISEIRQAQKRGGYLSGNILPDGTQIWKMDGHKLDVWNHGRWTKIKHISCHPIREAKMLCVTTRQGSVQVTDNHSIISSDKKEVAAKSLKPGNKILTTKMPHSEITEMHEDLAWLYGFFVAEGCIPVNGDTRRPKAIRLDQNKKRRYLLEKSKDILLRHLGADSYFMDGEHDMLRLTVKKPEKFMKFFDDCYAKDRNKRIPKIILNASKKTKLEFLRGYNLGDGRISSKKHRSEFVEFSTKSPILASGLCYLVESVLNVQYRIAVEHRGDEKYYKVCCHNQTNSKRGLHRIKPTDEVVDIREVPYSDEVWDFETENHWFNAGIGNIIVHNTGPRRGDVFAESSFAKQIALIERYGSEPIIKVGNTDSLRTYADVRDAVRAYHTLLTKNPIPGAYYNIGGYHTCRVIEVLSHLISLSGMNFNIVMELDRFRPIDADLQVPNCSKFKAHTGWEPEIPFEKTMADLLNYWRDRVRTNQFLTR